MKLDIDTRTESDAVTLASYLTGTDTDPVLAAEQAMNEALRDLGAPFTVELDLGPQVYYADKR